ncbi:MAG: hypothetical protein JRI40_09975 [Deltaproteobacteria bacterium]|nr:hypothetical protein [Deltaproteobacteria bacterium]MBW1965522.1 hypothetical protein [Deltaproteobacteria bacterium]
MCGICGLYDLGGGDLGDNCEEIVRAMTAQLRHRGPDEKGYHFHGPMAMGHARYFWGYYLRRYCGKSS